MAPLVNTTGHQQRKARGTRGGKKHRGATARRALELMEQLLPDPDVQGERLIAQEMVAKKVKPDPALSDLLMKAEVNSGRGSLAQGLFEQSPGDVAKHVAMIKASGKERNLEGAVNVFNKLKQGGVQMNSMIYNCLLDACVQCGGITTAH